MKITPYILSIQTHLVQTHSRVLDWFEEDDTLKNYEPQDGGWTIFEVLEHIALTSHFLLILIGKGTDKALKNTKDLSLQEELEDFDFDLEKMNKIGMHKSFAWIRPQHMEPQGEKTELEVKMELIRQMRLCLDQLERLENGEGLLNKTKMSVDDLGKISVYEYIYFLSKHAERHIQQMEENKDEFISYF